MKLTISIPLTFAVAIAPLALIPCTCNALAPPMHSSPPSTSSSSSSTRTNISGSGPYTSTETEAFVTRRSAAFSMFSCMFAVPGLALAADDSGSTVATAQKDSLNVNVEEVEQSEAAKAEAAKERMRQRIADSKKSYRKPTDLVKDRKETTDYSCVEKTGSPCPEGLVPRAVQREIVGALEKLESK